MELDTLWSIVTWTFGAALASPFIAFGLMLAVLVIIFAVEGVLFASFGAFYVGKFFYNLILYPFGKGGWRKTNPDKEKAKKMDCFDDTPEDGACPEDTDYRNCDEWIMMYEKYSGNKEKEVC